MRGLLIVLLECSVTMSVISLCFIALTPRLSKRYAAKWLYYGWLVIVIGLIIPFRFHPDTPLIQKDLFVDTVAVQQIASGGSGMMEQAQSQAGTQGLITDDSGTDSDGQKTASGIMEQLLRHPWHLWAGALWIFGTVIFIAFHGIRHRRFLQMIRRWSREASDQKTLDILQDQKLRLGISKRVELRTCVCIASPMMIGLVNPVILLPPVEYSVGELSLILRHELVHLKRGDLWYRILVFFATAIHWFNPVIYLIAKAIAVQCEISCDMEVVKETNLDRRQQYSETILNVIRNKTGMQTAFSTNFYGGKKEMKNRILYIMDGTKKKTGILILCAALILTLGSGVVFAAGSDNTGGLKPLTEQTGAFHIYYHPDYTLEENVLKTLGEDVPGYLGKVESSPGYIDINGRRISIQNRTEPYYRVKWDWRAKDGEAKDFPQRTLTIGGKEVIVAFSDMAASYRNDEVIEKTVRNTISFASVFKDEIFDYNYKAFIDELTDKGILVVREVTTPENFGWDYSSTTDTGFWASKVLTEYDKKEKNTSVYDGKMLVPINTTGNQAVQIGNSFTIRAGETLAIDIKEVTDNIPQINWAIVDLDTGETVDWMPNVLSGMRFIWTPSDKYVNNKFRVMTSTSLPVSDNAVLEIFTYKTGQQEMPSTSD